MRGLIGELEYLCNYLKLLTIRSNNVKSNYGKLIECLISYLAETGEGEVT